MRGVTLKFKYKFFIFWNIHKVILNSQSYEDKIECIEMASAIAVPKVVRVKRDMQNKFNKHRSTKSRNKLVHQ